MSDIAGRRITPHRPLELVAACMDLYGKGGLKIAVTISTPESGMFRKVFDCGPTPEGLVRAIREAADWLERDYVPKPVVETSGTYRAFTEQHFGTVES